MPGFSAWTPDDPLYFKYGHETATAYRPDADKVMTEAEYQVWKQQRDLAQAKAQAGIATDEEIRLLQEKARLQQAAQERGLAAMQGLLGGIGIGGGGGAVPPGSGGADAGTYAAEDAERAAAFARAKDTAGQVARSALTGLNEALAGKGLSGSKIGATAAGNIMNVGAGQLGEVARQQAMEAAENARKRASEQVQAATTRRGQDISLIQALTPKFDFNVSY